MKETKRGIVLKGCDPVYPFYPGTAALAKEWRNDPESEEIRKEWDRVFGRNDKEEEDEE